MLPIYSCFQHTCSSNTLHPVKLWWVEALSRVEYIRKTTTLKLPILIFSSYNVTEQKGWWDCRLSVRDGFNVWIEPICQSLYNVSVTRSLIFSVLSSADSCCTMWPRSLSDTTYIMSPDRQECNYDLAGSWSYILVLSVGSNQRLTGGVLRETKFPCSVNVSETGWLSLHVSPVMSWGPVQGVSCPSYNGEAGWSLILIETNHKKQPLPSQTVSLPLPSHLRWHHQLLCLIKTPSRDTEDVMQVFSEAK